MKTLDLILIAVATVAIIFGIHQRDHQSHHIVRKLGTTVIEDFWTTNRIYFSRVAMTNLDGSARLEWVTNRYW
jgi:hypothetical protein